MLGPNSLEGARSGWGVDVADNSNNHQWWGLNDSDGLDHFLLVDL